VILTERSEVDSESRRQPTVLIARSATDARARASFVAVVAVISPGEAKVAERAEPSLIDAFYVG
jgi:hypothetical protein